MFLTKSTQRHSLLLFTRNKKTYKKTWIVPHWVLSDERSGYFSCFSSRLYQTFQILGQSYFSHYFKKKKSSTGNISVLRSSHTKTEKPRQCITTSTLINCGNTKFQSSIWTFKAALMGVVPFKEMWQPSRGILDFVTFLRK